jgi:hypothetical protein
MCEMDPGNPMGRLFYVGVLVLNRCTDTARVVADAFPPEVRDTVPARIAFFLTRALASEARAHAVRTEEIERLATAADVFPRMIAQGHALARMPEHAIRWLALAVERGFINYPFSRNTIPVSRTSAGCRNSSKSSQSFATDGRGSRRELERARLESHGFSCAESSRGLATLAEFTQRTLYCKVHTLHPSDWRST